MRRAMLVIRYDGGGLQELMEGQENIQEAIRLHEKGGESSHPLLNWTRWVY